MTREELKKECVIRLKKLGIMQECINAFEKDNAVWKSEIDGILYELDEQEKDIVGEFESAYNCMVYHIIKTYTKFGTILNLLYVNEDKDEWKYFDTDLQENITFVYAENLDEEMFSEFGSIGIRAVNGGLERIS